MNVSGAGITTHAKNRANAAKFHVAAAGEFQAAAVKLADRAGYK